jgi:hypothetical protein
MPEAIPLQGSGRTDYSLSPKDAKRNPDIGIYVVD